MRLRHHTPDALRVELAHALGFPNYPAEIVAEPYLNYITNLHVGRGTIDGYIRLMICIIKYFDDRTTEKDGLIPTKSIQGLLNALSISGDAKKFADVEDTAMYAIGVWTLMLNSFVHVPIMGGLRKVTIAYTLRTQNDAAKANSQPYQDSLPNMIRGSGLLPAPGRYSLLEGSSSKESTVQAAARLLASLNPTRPTLGTSTPSSVGSLNSSASYDAPDSMALAFLDSLDSMESLTVKATRLNAYTLSVFGSVEIVWTYNISRHLVLSKRDGRHSLEIFALPCALEATSLSEETSGISLDLCQEIRESYCSLFSAWPSTLRHAKFSRMMGIEKLCWCWWCSAQRHQSRVISTYKKFSKRNALGKLRLHSVQNSEYDPLLIELMKKEPIDWTPDLFPSLWSRITIIEQHLQAARPLSIWVLFWDRRDTLQFWTFFFATIVVGLTALQVLLSVAQVVGSFVK